MSPGSALSLSPRREVGGQRRLVGLVVHAGFDEPLLELLLVELRRLLLELDGR